MPCLMRCLVCLLLAAAPVCAQGWRPYVQFPIKNAEELLKMRLQLEKDLGPLKDLVNQALTDPKRINGTLLDQFKGIKLQDAKLKEALHKWLNEDSNLRQNLQKWVKQVKQEAPAKETKSLEALERILEKSAAAKSSAPPAAVPTAQPKTTENALAQAIEKGMKRAEDSGLGDWLKDSPAWKRAFEDLQASIDSSRAPNWKLGDWPSKLLTPDSKAWELGRETFARLRSLPAPELDRWRPSLSLPRPRVGVPALPRFGGRSLPTMNSGALWLLLALACLLTTWQMLRWSRRPVLSIDPSAGLGPWPIRPEQVATRADLVTAFDYLALLTLGADAKSWHHRIIARSWSERNPACAPTATALARLYEQARYTDGPAQLAAPARDQARQALARLAEAA